MNLVLTFAGISNKSIENNNYYFKPRISEKRRIL